MFDEQCVHKDSIYDRESENIHRTRNTVPVLPSRNTRTIFSYPEVELLDIVVVLEPDDIFSTDSESVGTIVPPYL